MEEEFGFDDNGFKEAAVCGESEKIRHGKDWESYLTEIGEHVKQTPTHSETDERERVINSDTSKEAVFTNLSIGLCSSPQHTLCYEGLDNIYLQGNPDGTSVAHSISASFKFRPTAANVVLSAWWNFYYTMATVVLLHSSYIGVSGELTVHPINTIQTVGQVVRLNCSTDLQKPVYWARTPAGSDLQHWLYYGKNGFNGRNSDRRFRMEKDPTSGNHDVVISNVQRRDAGTYVCVDDSGLGVRASAELIVTEALDCHTGTPPDGVMGYNVFDIPEEMVNVACSLSYSGNLVPSLIWSSNGSSVQQDLATLTLTDGVLNSTLNLPAKKEHNKARFRCETVIPQPLPSHNQRNEGLVWESAPVVVRYAEFESIEVEECPGFKWNLICNPTCSYRVQRSADSGCICIATYNSTKENKLREQVSDSTICDMDRIASQSISPLVVVGLCIGFTLLLLLAIGGVVLLLFKKHQNRKGNSEKGHQNGTGDSDTSLMSNSS